MEVSSGGADNAELVDPWLSIGAFARRSRLSMKALRLYERLAILKPAEVDRSTGYRRYRESQLITARLVAMLRRLDMPLAQVAEVVAVAAPAAPEVTTVHYVAGARNQAAAGAAELVGAYWRSVEQRVASQRTLAEHLQIRLLGQEGSLRSMFNVQQREVPEQLVLTEQRHVQVHELSDWLAQAMGRLMGTANQYGGVVAPGFVVYHGEVNQDSDGPVEVCLPIAIAAGTESASGAPMRREPAHREAYVRITRAQVQYPQILSAFDAVGQWLSANSIAMAGPPREIYFADFAAAAPGDEVCDVAFPTAIVGAHQVA